MLPKKMLLPLGGGDELKERMIGALLISKYFDAHLEVLRSEATPKKTLTADVFAPPHLVKEMERITQELETKTSQKYISLFKEACAEAKVPITDTVQCDGKPTASLTVGSGLRSTLVEKHSKLCDMVIATKPPYNIPTATFKAAVLNSGKPVLIIPREMKTFDPSRIIILWNASTEASRALYAALPFMKIAKEILIVTRQTTAGEVSPSVEEVKNYLSIHNINVACDVVIPTKTRGEALLKKAIEGNFGLIVAGTYSQSRMRERFFGGVTTYLLENSEVPVLTAH